ncbi:hypothetical protein ACSVDE_03240 [Pseudalkalibacillus sp. Hm43]|uniref:hypothetical protein n=1 Tax=Pseudalkalibacillus sp. Hm43 TaxID=3450742 RepID=UPI003F423C3A
MGSFLNIGSFLLMLVCVVWFLTQVFFEAYLPQSLGYPLIFGCVVFTFIIGVVGTIGVDNWKSAARTISTVLMTGALSIMLTFIVFIGALFG